MTLYRDLLGRVYLSYVDTEIRPNLDVKYMLEQKNVRCLLLP